MLPESPQITSFIIRFVHGEAAAVDQPIRGTVRHILSHQEVHFTSWEEAVRFINQFVPLEPGISFESSSQTGME